MWFYGVDAAQAAAREPVAWFALIVTIAALLTWGWCSISYTTFPSPCGDKLKFAEVMHPCLRRWSFRPLAGIS